MILNILTNLYFLLCSIVAMYLGIVYICFRVIRFSHYLWPYTVDIEEMPNVNRIYNICMAVYQVRSSREYVLEEDLYAKLLFVLRSAEVRVLHTRYVGDRLIQQHCGILERLTRVDDDNESRSRARTAPSSGLTL